MELSNITLTKRKKISFCKRLLVSPRFYFGCVVFQVFILAIFVTKKNTNNGDVMLVIKERKIQEEIFNNTVENCLLFNTSEPQPKIECPIISPYLIGHKKPDISDEFSWEDTLQKYSSVRCGGHFRPSNCKARQKVALLIPFRNRYVHLKIFINHIHPFLMRQQLEYGIYIIDLDDEIQFNRGLLLNVAFLEASKEYDYDCYIFHDVDLLPENDYNFYRCSDLPRHMSVAVDKHNYKLPYVELFGGVSAMTKDQILFVNGFSNKYSGWGGEDDDMYNRLEFYHMTVFRSMEDISRYTMLKHAQSPPNPNRFKLKSTGMKRLRQDGVKNLKYKIMKRTDYPLFTYMKITL
ncbi:beta-1,4-galactosyltransferase 1-like [Saccostrea echinata]|uniref:beta-1,4-galactosyltransferase 1-like n=1 Tax=Saccostrea echinata TaxID=191078 RepID=UPI002A8120DE|nr:beta-1,4-galactosyltransferase 1-like [Saccostrea echinata]XP_061195868.1 beta-1,4-galactosyltransferase 1-like [Saccostrea echinata]XP_061195869.1 beta-1,4-galactosyltransferase 1-like [Saccostrea echinata]